MSDGKRRINIIIRPDGQIEAATEGLYGGDCLPYMELVFNALDAVPAVPLDQASALLSNDYFSHVQDGFENSQTARRKNYIFE